MQSVKTEEWVWTICESFFVLCEGHRVLLFIGVLLVNKWQYYSCMLYKFQLFRVIKKVIYFSLKSVYLKCSLQI